MSKFKKGDIFQVTTGRYDDYGVECVAKALKDIELEKLQDHFKKDYEQYLEDYCIKKSNKRLNRYAKNNYFCDWLISAGYVERIKHREMFLDNDGDEFKIEIFNEGE